MATTPNSDIVLTIETSADQSTYRHMRMDAVPGQRIILGDCNDGCCDVDFRSVGMAGHITAYATHWTIANHSRHTPIRVRNAERAHDMFTIDPGQGDTAVPFDFAKLAGHKGTAVTVYGPVPNRADSTVTCAGEPVPAWGLNPTSMHYQVMLAIARGATNDGEAFGPPTAAQISRQLHIDVRQVHEHIEYLIEKLKITQPSNAPTRDWRRYALFEFALRHPHIPPNGR